MFPFDKHCFAVCNNQIRMVQLHIDKDCHHS